MPAQWIISGSIWHDSRHASASIPIPSTPWNGAREDSGKIIKITWITWSVLSISCQLKHDLPSHGFPPVDQWHPHIPSPPVADVWSLVTLLSSHKWHTSSHLQLQRQKNRKDPLALWWLRLLRKWPAWPAIDKYPTNNKASFQTLPTVWISAQSHLAFSVFGAPDEKGFLTS